ncbi:hypothetical protein [Kribbella catacumbae]|uniref:hypothetical protein n=1 Tax=Kribbella catacumbae TaxID=460086 RepID=UPI0012F9BB2E|nr:hypothetical protein [Kribbella catacumbae]
MIIDPAMETHQEGWKMSFIKRSSVAQYLTRAGTIGVASVAALLSSTTVSSAVDAQPDLRTEGQECAIIIGKSPAGQASPTLGAACSSVSADAALAAAETQANPGRNRKVMGSAVAQSSTLLMRYWEHINYQGTSYKVYGAAGPCDADGYSFYPDSGPWSWGDVMSSVEGFNGCNWAKFVHQNGTTVRSYWLPVRDLGAVNDNVSYIKVSHR